MRITQLAKYCYDCIREEFKSSSFRNLDSDKNNLLYLTNKLTWQADNQQVLDIAMKYELNKTDRALIYGSKFLTGTKGKNKYFTPLVYQNLTIENQGAKLVGSLDNEKILNVGAISSLLSEDEEQASMIISQLMEVINKDIFDKVLTNLVNLENFSIDNKNSAIILTKLPDASAGLLNELEQIANK